MTSQWITLTVLGLALAGHALARPSGNGPAPTPEERPGIESGAASPGMPGEGVERSTGTAGVDRSTGAPTGQEDPRRRDRRTLPGAPGTENGSESGDGTGTEGRPGGMRPPPPPAP
ncbi:MAG: hypothetical protein Q8T11_11630 [Elusimicrobiota bacterium]|nr:hypothetical protein [Elusimicrobiota bacterium]